MRLVAQLALRETVVVPEYPEKDPLPEGDAFCVKPHLQGPVEGSRGEPHQPGNAFLGLIYFV
jgi:hypothetical protein